MQRPTQKTSRYARLTRLILVAFCVGLFCAPQTFAGSGSRITLASFGAEDSSDFRRDGEPGGYISWRHTKTTPADGAAFSAGFGAVNASRAPVQSSCAPRYECFGFYPQVCWYELINPAWNTSCTRKWVFPNGYQPVVGNPCTGGVYRSASLVVLPDAGTFYQNFSVPSDATGPLDVDVWYQTRGGGTHWDRIYVELYEGNTRLGLYRFPSASNCVRATYTFGGNYAGKNLRLKVAGSIVTPGVEHYVEQITLVSYVP